jgi:endonuclease/exonuclease/phosphatase (EEP) superfamily protein YafD
MIRRILAAVVVLVIAAILLVALWPQLFGLQEEFGVAQVVSLRGWAVVVGGGLAVIVGIVALGWRAARRFLGTITVLLLVFALANLAILNSRGWASSTTKVQSTGQITVLSWNTRGGVPGAARIAALALAEHADVVALPETRQATGVAIATAMKQAGHPMWVLSAARGYVYGSHATTLLVSSALGKYSVDQSIGDTTVLPAVVARPDDGSGPEFVAVHSISPKPHEMRNWRSDLTALAALCTGPNTIMAGDFNATLDVLHSHSASQGRDFGSCTDAARTAGGAATGSWPTSLPQFFGAQIDHVMYTGAWKVKSMHVVMSEDSAGSDHRPVVVTLGR